MKIEIKLTNDNSHTLFVPELDETYHSIHGAIQEANHVFIDAGLGFYDEKQELNVLEVGFGTGLNALLACIYAAKNKTNLNYIGVELNPVALNVIEQLNYTEEIEGASQELFLDLHKCEWEKLNEISEYFDLTKVKFPILEVEKLIDVDVVFFDAFGPNAQAEMWDKPVFEMLYNAINQGGILVTYCAKGSVKRTLKEVGFKIEALPGPPGKREMTRAIKL